ncbi:MAG: hypothetical protein JKY22_00475 [Flavobacteriaceae bacterium]|nr:hypothetical protein [Flavobacteriaceae bacterium]
MKLIICLILSWFSLHNFAQQDESRLGKTTIGPSFTTQRKSNFSGFIGQSESTLFLVDYLAINRKKQELTLRRMDANTLELIDSKDLFSVINSDFYNEPNEIFYQNNNLYLFSTVSGLKDKFNMVYLEIFNEYGERIDHRVVDTLELDEEYYLSESVEKEGFLLVTHNKFLNNFEQIIGLQTIENTGKTGWRTEVKSPNLLQSLTIENILYSKNAPIYILCDYGFEAGTGSVRENSTDLINSKFSLWAYDHQKEFLKEFDLRLKNRWINGIAMDYNSSQELVISGFINETRNQTINGVFSLKIGQDLKLIGSNYYKYKRSFFEKFVDARRIEKTKELENIQLRDLIILEDDPYFILGEHFYQYTERNYDPRTNITTTSENYNYNSIIAAYFDENGNHMWSDRIPKFQHTVNDYGYFSSFSVMNANNEVYLFFNDTERNNDLAVNDYFNYTTMSNNRRFQISCVQIGQDGVHSRGPIVGSNNNFMLRARLNYQIDPATFYLYGEVGKSRKVFSVKALK